MEEGLRLSRERAAEKARLEKAALEKANREKKELEDKKEVYCACIAYWVHNPRIATPPTPPSELFFFPCALSFVFDDEPTRMAWHGGSQAVRL